MLDLGVHSLAFSLSFSPSLPLSPNESEPEKVLIVITGIVDLKLKTGLPSPTRNFLFQMHFETQNSLLDN